MSRFINEVCQERRDRWLPDDLLRELMPLLRLNDISLSFGGPPLLDGVALQIEAGERIGLVGRNGSGKSTLMKLAGRPYRP